MSKLHDEALDSLSVGNKPIGIFGLLTKANMSVQLTIAAFFCKLSPWTSHVLLFFGYNVVVSIGLSMRPWSLRHFSCFESTWLGLLSDQAKVAKLRVFTPVARRFIACTLLVIPSLLCVFFHAH